nr:MAG TPA: hypothetical protein [Caudoviricetes sp.]
MFAVQIQSYSPQREDSFYHQNMEFSEHFPYFPVSGGIFCRHERNQIFILLRSMWRYRK